MTKARYAILNQICQLDPSKTISRSSFWLANESPFLIQRALEFALFRTFALPRTAQLLAETGSLNSVVRNAMTTRPADRGIRRTWL